MRKWVSTGTIIASFLNGYEYNIIMLHNSLIRNLCYVFCTEWYIKYLTQIHTLLDKHRNHVTQNSVQKMQQYWWKCRKIKENIILRTEEALIEDCYH